MEKINVVGYYADRDYKVDEADGEIRNSDVFVAIEIEGDILHYYAPVGQHGEGAAGYLDDCTSITKEQYLKASKPWYTPKEYL